MVANVVIVIAVLKFVCQIALVNPVSGRSLLSLFLSLSISLSLPLIYITFLFTFFALCSTSLPLFINGQFRLMTR
jgi:hypothetical protein